MDIAALPRLDGTTIFESVLWDYPLSQDTAYGLTFETDSGLRTGDGWDNVTGLGTPNAQAFVNAFKP